MNKKYIVFVSMILGLSIFGVSVEALTRYRLDLVSVPVLKVMHHEREIISSDQVVMTLFPRKYVPDNVYLTKDDVVSKYVTLGHKVYQGIPIFEEALVDLEASHDEPLLLLKEGQSVVSLKTDITKSMGGIISKGHYVDVSIVVRNARKESSAQTLLKQVRVVGVKDNKGVETVPGQVPTVILLAIDSNLVERLLREQALGDTILTLVEKTSEQESQLNEGFLMSDE